jgi:hypothetical protein
MLLHLVLSQAERLVFGDDKRVQPDTPRRHREVLPLLVFSESEKYFRACDQSPPTIMAIAASWAFASARATSQVV